MSDVRHTIISWIQHKIDESGAQVVVDAQTRLLEEGLLDSVQIIELVQYAEQEFNVKIDLKDLIPENFADPEAVVTMIENAK